MAFTQEQQFFVDQYRNFLSMETQKVAGSSFQLPQRLGDTELWLDLRLGLNFFNSYPPIITTFRFKDLYNASLQASNNGLDPIAPENEDSTSIYMHAIFMCAMFYSCLRLQWFEAGKHFRYSDNGISIERVKQADYANIAGGSVLQYITQVLPNLRKVLGLSRVSIKGQFSGMVAFPRSLTRGLRGTRLGSGR